jgi:hypothetical protein
MGRFLNAERTCSSAISMASSSGAFFASRSTTMSRCHHAADSNHFAASCGIHRWRTLQCETLLCSDRICTLMKRLVAIVVGLAPFASAVLSRSSDYSGPKFAAGLPTTIWSPIVGLAAILSKIQNASLSAASRATADERGARATTPNFLIRTQQSTKKSITAAADVVTNINSLARPSCN